MLRYYAYEFNDSFMISIKIYCLLMIPTISDILHNQIQKQVSKSQSTFEENFFKKKKTYIFYHNAEYCHPYLVGYKNKIME